MKPVSMSDDKMEFFTNKPSSGYIRFIEDDVLSDILVDKIKNNEIIKHKGDIETIKNNIQLILFQSIFTEWPWN